MTEINVPYSKGYLTATTTRDVVHIMPKQVAPVADPVAAVEYALDNPLGGTLRRVESVAIAVNDKTRPVPHNDLLPPLFERLTGLGIVPERITLIIATGAHAVMPIEEYGLILPADVVRSYSVLCHDCQDDDNLVYLGETSRKTPVYVNRHFMEADLRIVIGNIEPHQFMGFSGGVKSAAIGLTSKATITHNHAMMNASEARLGQYDNNPARQDVEEIGRMIGIDFALNALLNDKKQIVDVLAGDPVEVMRVGIPRVSKTFQVEVERPFDLIIVSPGGYPKDIDIYQSQKALAHAALITKDGGTIILCAACSDGAGSEDYEKWVKSTKSHEDVLRRFKQEGFHVGPHKAFQIARDAVRVQVRLISDLNPDFARKLLLYSVPDLQTALNEAVNELPEDARIGVMPAANVTIPIVT
jgi:lactate racemase